MMIGLMMAAAAAGAALAGVAAVARMALRRGHLLVLRGPGGTPRWYERGDGGRYAPIPLVQLPAALRRSVCGTPAAVRVRAEG